MSQNTSNLPYDPNKTFDENFDEGPFGKFAAEKAFENKGEPKHKFLGFPVYLPFGIAAGPLPTSKHTTGAFRNGYDVNVYKTQRTVALGANPFPNIIPIDVDGDITLQMADKGLTMADKFNSNPKKLTITNSFGNPSRGPEFWKADLKKALSGQAKGQLLIMSVCGTIRENQTQEEYLQDFADAAKTAVKAGAKVVELNLSCPNVANEGIVCYTPEAVKIIAEKTRKAVGKDVKIILKFAFFSKDQEPTLEKMLSEIDDKIDGIAAINTIQAAVYKKDGSQALPGEGRLRSGLCGAGIKWAGLEMVKRLDYLRKKNGFKYEIIGVGGVMEPADYQRFIDAGANCVMACTGPMWNPDLAKEIKASL